MRKGLIILTVFIVLIFFYSCGKKGPEAESQPAQSEQEQTIEGQEPTAETTEPTQELEEKQSQTTPQDPMAAMKEFTEQMKEQSEKQAGGEITVADEATLTSVLRPISGWEMQEPSYSKSSMGSLTVSDLETAYTMNGKTIAIKIADAGTAQSALAPVKVAISMNLSREDSEGFQKVFEYKGHKGVEEYHKLNNRSEVTLIYKDRYIISIRSDSGLTTKDLKEFLPKLDLSKLE